MIIFHCIGFDNEVFDIFLTEKEAKQYQRRIMETQDFTPIYYKIPLNHLKEFKEEYNFLIKKTKGGYNETNR